MSRTAGRSRLRGSHQQPQEQADENPREDTKDDTHHDAARCRKAVPRRR
jgi:hypothetical protein